MPDSNTTSAPASPPNDVKFQPPPSGSFWSETKLAFQNFSFWEPFKSVEKIPCARNSLLSGIASGAGIGLIRGISAGAFVASNWAVGTFMIVSIGSWHICQRRLEEEHRKMQQVVEHIPKRFAKKNE